MDTNSRNPYIGPRTYQREEASLFFGRDRESRDLLGLIESESVVLFYAPSGAGKSSLINTLLLPALEAEEYEVLPIGRVSGQGGADAENIYIYHLLTSLAQQDLDPPQIRRLTLSQFLRGLRRDEAGFTESETPSPASQDEDEGVRRLALIIDQFEELFSTHADHWQQREGFFQQIAEALRDHPALSILLSMRQDYIGLLDPYVWLLPNKLRVRYSMRQLEREKALYVIRRPAEYAGRPFAAGVAEKLVDDLSGIQILKPDGGLEIQPGQYVEPSQIQVACYSLWENLGPEKSEITEQDLREVGDVDQALGNFYAARVKAVAQKWKLQELFLRDWFERSLILPGGVRNLVIQDANGSVGGLDARVIQELPDLVRSERRGGSVFYELTHDRLVEPVLRNNERWRQEHLNSLQQRARLWQEQGRSENFLLSNDMELHMVKEWLRENPFGPTEREEEFLAASQSYLIRKNFRSEEISERRLRRLRVMIAFLIFLAIGAFFYGYYLGVSASG